MKYIPITDKDRIFVSGTWNKKYLRAIKVVLNVTHGAVMPGESFFYEAFGKDIDESFMILLLPEDYIFYRFMCKASRGGDGRIEQWENDIKKLKEFDSKKYNELKELTKKNSFRDINLEDYDFLEQKVLKHYINRIPYAEYKEWKENKRDS